MEIKRMRPTRLLLYRLAHKLRLLLLLIITDNKALSYFTAQAACCYCVMTGTIGHHFQGLLVLD